MRGTNIQGEESCQVDQSVGFEKECGIQLDCKSN